MNSVGIIIYLCVAFSPHVIHCGHTIPMTPTVQNLISQLDRMAERGENINNIFKPSKNGFLGVGFFSVTFKGTLLYQRNIDVAMKFTFIQEKAFAKNEYKMLTYLHAIDNPEVELYGIPAVYYYGNWGNYIMMGITLLETTFNDYYADGGLEAYDVLILFKEFVRISKYIHSCGVQHNDIAARNIMFRKNNGFIIDYNKAEKIYNTTNIDANSLKSGIGMAKKDWCDFLQVMCDFFAIDVSLENAKTKSEISAVINKMELGADDDLQSVLRAMAMHTLHENHETSSYDRIYDLIEREIDSYGERKPPLMSWLRGKAEGEKVIEEFRSNPIKHISSIRDPFELKRIEYPVVDFQYFDKKLMSLSSGKSRKTCSSVGSSKTS